MKKIIWILLGMALVGRAWSQSVDSASVFTQEAYFEWIMAYHPLVKQANLLTAEAQANLRMARGGFDPKLYADWQQKSFDDKTYFNIGEGGFKIPTWYGLEVKGYFNSTNGVFLNPENKLPAAGQAVAGIKASVGQGLFIDERRADLQKAKMLEKANEAERLNAINNVLLDAAAAYWDWVKTYQEMQTIEQALQVSRQRLRGIVESFYLGDKPGIDTLETYIQVQTWEFELNEARLNYRNAGLFLSNYLWLENDVPLEITAQLRPPRLDELETQAPLPALDQYVQLFDITHPQLRFYQVKLSQLEIDRRLAAEQLKPRLDIEYNLLGEGFNFNSAKTDDNGAFNDLLLQNYKWGLNFSFPLFLRKERGKLDLTKIKILETDYTLQQKRLELTNKLRDAYNEWQNTQQQIALYQNVTNNYRRLLEAEYEKFSIGESSIFLINTREQKLIEAQLKLIKLQAEFHKNRTKVEWAAGRLGI
ncbi:MAG: TolC family protein [Saprospiraceae bacterium]|nr:TolC family protein [Saprospiraceae bacterium]